MRVSKRDAKLLLILLGIVVFLLSYLLVYNRYIDKRDQVSAQIAELQPTLDTLEEYYTNLATYEAAIDTAKSTVETEMNRYPTEVFPEDELLYARELETRVGIAVNSVAFSDPVLVNEFNGIVPGSQDETAVVMDAYQSTSTVSCDLSYNQLKTLLSYIYDTKSYTGVSSLTVSYDAEKAALTGTVDVAKFFITYSDAQPARHTMPTVSKGQANLFG